MAPSQEFKQNPFSILDDSTLYCQEEKWEDYDEDFDEKDEIFEGKNSFLLPLLLLNQDLFIEDEELLSLFSKEKKEGKIMGSSSSYCCLRKEAIEWIIKVNSYNGFCTLTSVLAIYYLDRFFASFNFQNDKPWMFQLGAVACLSIAAKVEETYVPLLLDIQGEGAKYVFDAKTIQKMELLVLSTLEWKMNPVTPLSFLDHIIRRLGLKNHLHWEFLRRCEQLLLSLLSDWRFVSYLPSILATATMMHVIDQIEPCNPLDYQNQLLAVLNISKDKVNECYQLIVEKSSSYNKKSDDNNTNLKRTFDEMIMTINNFLSPPTTTTFSDNVTYPSSPSGVMDAYYLSSDSSNDAWVATTIMGNSSSSLSSSLSSSSSLASSVTSSPVIPRKKSRVHEQPMPLQLPSLSRVFAEEVGSPR